ncbi:MAG: hypothetical protein K0R50_31 [Eubacterium sp.]|jgi:hypothetical protein|nr:hypothetical protein [Eubacterium sp.]
MRYLKDIQPYNKFWGNCITNMFLSILLTIDPSYEPLIYLNSYQYSYSWDNYFNMDYTQEYYDYFKDNLFVFTSAHFVDKNNFLQEFKAVLANNLYATLNVDLFYWNDAGAFYNKVHIPHYSFIIGFDEEKDVFYAFEDDLALNYEIREIPTERVIQSFFSDHKNSNLENYRIITFKNNHLPPYEIDLNHFLVNAERLVNNLDMLIKRTCIFDKSMLVNNISNVYFYKNELGKISYRLTGNILLFNDLKNKGMFNETLTNLIETINELSIHWKQVQNSFVKYCLKNNYSEIDKIEKKIFTLFIKEKEMWETILHCF